MPTEADTCRKFTVPALQQAGWEEDPHSIGEQRAITDGRIVPRGKGCVRRPPKRADYLLYYHRDFIIAVVEAKKEGIMRKLRQSQTAATRPARALGESIFTEADAMDELRQQIGDAVACHFEDGMAA